jgi:DHA1 family tetracycline resistance protein-like MFS transporter
MREYRGALRRQLPIYGAGVFSNSNVTIASLVVPLWALEQNLSASWIGILLGARHVPGLFLAIHGGVLMDRIGARPLMVFFAVVAVLVPLFFPMMPWVGAMIALQMVWGLSTTMTWIGAQTAVSQMMRGSTRHAGRLSVAVRLGMLAGPPIAGLGWDLFGPWGGFGAISVWALGLLVSCLLLPEPAPGAAGGSVRRFRAGDLVPRLSDYIAAFNMLSVPAVAICAYLSAIRIGSYGVQESFYIVYLEKVGMSGTEIGLLAGTGHSLLGAVGALIVGMAPAMGSVRRQLWMFLASLVVAIALLAITPLMTAFWPLFAAILLRGLLLGFNQPLMISIMAGSTDPGSQGMTVGLRTTLNRAASVVVPVIMGVVIDRLGIEQGFYAIGVGLTLCCLATAVLLVGASRRGRLD